MLSRAALCLLLLCFTPPGLEAAERRAALVEVFKADRLLVLRGADQTILRSFAIALGGDPLGHKQSEGDEKTPEGRYILDWRNSNSSFYRSLHISYPNQQDLRNAAADGRNPGGAIMIHGIRNGFGWIGSLHRFIDWTNGCIAVTNREMDEIWSLVPDGTPIEIHP